MSQVDSPAAQTHMLIRAPIKSVFGAFVDPAITSRFWFTRGSGKVEPDAELTWHWDMYGASAQVKVVAFEADKGFAIEWPTRVDWKFIKHSEDSTFVVITASRFTGSEDEQAKKAIDSMGGFSFVLAGCKCYLEHGIELNLVRDHNPIAHSSPAA